MISVGCIKLDDDFDLNLNIIAVKPWWYKKKTAKDTELMHCSSLGRHHIFVSKYLPKIQMLPFSKVRPKFEFK